jgi:hypothetical protein
VTEGTGSTGSFCLAMKGFVKTTSLDKLVKDSIEKHKKSGIIY